jgi:uncharacterized membrane protein YqaE (UPF0057 family)
MKKRLPFLLVALMMLFNTTASYAVSMPSLPANEPGPSAVKSAMKDFNSLSKKEKKQKVKEVKKQMRDYKAKKKAGEPVTNTLLLVIIAILLPPLAVYLHQGEINSKFWIDLLLTLLFYVPGLIYALVVILGNE